MQRSLNDSPVTAGCIKFKASDTLKKREPKFYDGLHLTGAPLGPDGEGRHLRHEAVFN